MLGDRRFELSRFAGRLPAWVLLACLPMALLIPGAHLKALEPDPDSSWPFSSSEHCVAYHTVKGMFLFFDAEVLGKNCQLEAELSMDAAEDRFRLALTIPVGQFNSQNNHRDEDIAEILGGGSKLPLLFLSDWAPRQWARNLLDGRTETISGVLVIANKEHPLTFHLRVPNQGPSHLIQAWMSTTFSALGVTVPPVGPGGLIAAPRERLDLMAQLHLSRLKGMEQLLTPP